jgi:hypothetical protein
MPLNGPGFKFEAGGEEKVGGQPAVVLKFTFPDGKDMTISFDKQTGLPVKAVGKVLTLLDQEVTQETTYGDCSRAREMCGLQRGARAAQSGPISYFHRSEGAWRF